MINLLLPALAYLLGSLSSAVLLCRIMRLPDPRSTGSHNPGATNVLRLGGKKAAIIVLIGDVLKGLVPILVAKTLSDQVITVSLVGIAAFLGHLYPLFFQFKGGKGVATAAGVFIGLSGTLIGLLLGIWIIIAMIFRYSSLAALVCAALAPFLVLWLLSENAYFLLSVGIAVLLFWRHRENISRLLAGTESKISFTD